MRVQNMTVGVQNIIISQHLFIILQVYQHEPSSDIPETESLQSPENDLALLKISYLNRI